MTKQAEQYGRGAAGWSDREYASPGAYLQHRAHLVVELGTTLPVGSTVLDLACGDGGLGEVLVSHGRRYIGVDSTPEMVNEAAHRLSGRAEIHHGDLNSFVPERPVAATTLFRALYYADDRGAFFAHVLGFTRTKLVFDLNPRQYAPAVVEAELRDAGFVDVVFRPFFVPQTVALPRLAIAAAHTLERSGPLARLALRYRFTYLVAATVPGHRDGTQSNPT